ncbi:Predicted NAD/FAD-binding protein [Cupriavidus sp. YR651]|uniref:NAD(P)/FAD-dependent oxidoreductase n=1 Tax=Cupriavidus sp. YR651 TaxID=1855315 RepID=UPI00087F6BEF|nr:FAD-dependent oxidoreductase [Cupriavidus sp. YR651]SDD55302.1 Predicted NAD/FAD-binding protein [Cupriavidus sp. YR651]
MSASLATKAGSRVAVVGGGIAGMATAWLLARRHRVTLFEAGDYLGGHTNTVDVTLDGHTAPVDTGFLVFNERTYPNLVAMFDELGVASHASDMSFSVSMDRGRMEWAGTSLNTVFAQRRNAFSPTFLGMLRDIVRFNGTARRNVAHADATGCSLGDLLLAGNYGQPFRQHYLLPMAAAIWSCATTDVLQFPAATFLRFCLNHALLQISNRPQWRTVAGGGREYVRRLAGQLDDVRLRARVRAIRRDAVAVNVMTDDGTSQFDAVVLATHAPDSLHMLADPSDAERDVLSAVRYAPNVAILHTDPTLLPRRPRVWSAWNYLGGALDESSRAVCVSYLVNQLQPLPFRKPVVVTLNAFRQPAPGTELRRFYYQHPLFDLRAIAAQQALPALQGQRCTWYAGAWTGYGFHEDGLKSALRVANDFGVLPSWSKL